MAHPREEARLGALHALQVLDGPADAQFDRLTALAASLFDVPTALISLVDKQRQWFLSRTGLDAPETPRNVAFCGHALHEEVMLVVPDAHMDPRFATNPLVTGAPFVRFYAGVVLRDRDALPLGTLCLVSPLTRAFPDADRRLLVRLGELVTGELMPGGSSGGRRAGIGADRRTGALTGTLSADRFAHHVDHLLQLAGSESTVAAIIVVPELERVNEIFGTTVGDALLLELVSRLGTLVRTHRGGVIGRLGGRRLAFCAANPSEAIDPDALAAACRTVLLPPFEIAGQTLSPDLQVGIATGDGATDGARALLARCRRVIAGQAVAHGLQVGRMDERGQVTMHRRLRVAADLGDAIAHDDLRLVCQPKYACATGEVTGFECLLRWQHDELGHIPPPDVLDAAADVNLLLELDCWVADRALAQVARWRRSNLAAGVVSINVPARRCCRTASRTGSRVGCATTACPRRPSSWRCSRAACSTMSNPSSPRCTS